MKSLNDSLEFGLNIISWLRLELFDYDEGADETD